MEKYFERFSPIKKLGVGGFAEVWLAFDEKKNFEVALKILIQKDEISCLKFKREFYTLSKLRDEGIVEVYDYFQNSHILYSMEYIKGMDIRKYLFSYAWCKDGERNGPYYIYKDGIEKAFEIFYQISKTLHQIHIQNIIHRDLKPENIFYDLEKNHIKILDFGLIKEEIFDEYKTKKEIIQGTPAYISPEYIKGKEIDHRADLYSLGVIFYELLTGKLPFYSNSIFDLLEKHIKEIPIPPKEHNHLIPSKLNELILKLLEKEPYLRFSYAIEVAERIKKIWEDFKEGREEIVKLEEKTIAIPIKLPEKIISAPYIGQKEEIKKIEGALKDLIYKKGRIILIEGEHGIGKSRLLEEIKAKAIEYNFNAFLSASKEEIPFSYYPFQKIAKEILRKEKGKLREEEIIFKFFPEIQKEILKEEEYKTLPQIDPKSEKARFFYGFFSIFKKLCNEKPLVLLFDDFQWIDEASLELLSHLIHMLLYEEEYPVIFCISYVEEETPKEVQIFFAKIKEKSLKITLKPFGPEEVQIFLQKILTSEEPFPISFISQLLNQTGGNPYLIMETIRTLIDEKILRRHENRKNWIFTQFVDSIRASIALEKMVLPSSIKENFLLKLKKYQEKEISTLQAAAFLGKRFPFILWQKISDIKDDELFDLAEKLLKDKILKEMPEENLEFVNEQIRKALTDEISGLKKKRIQSKIANAIFELYREVPEDLYITVAQCLEETGRTKEALFYYEELGKKALGVYNLLSAEKYYLKVLEYSEDEKRAEALKKLGDINSYIGNYDKAEDYFKQAIKITKEGSELFFGIKLSMVFLFAQMGNIKEMEEKLDEVFSIIEKEKNIREYAWANYYKGILNYQKGNQNEAIDLFHKALMLFEELNEVEGLLSTYSILPAPHFITGKIEEAKDILKKALEISSKYTDFRRKLVILSNLVSIYNDTGELEKAKELMEEAFKIAQGIGDLRLYSHILYLKGSLLKRENKFDEAILFLEKAKNLSFEINAMEMYICSNLSISTLKINKKDYENALNEINETIKISEEINFSRVLPVLNFLKYFVEYMLKKIEFTKEVEKAFEEIRKTNDCYEIAENSIYFSKILKNENQIEKAYDILKEALQISKEKKFLLLQKEIEEEIMALGALQK